MYWGYNTNGAGNHRLSDAIGILAELGYQAVAITLDNGTLDPFDRDLRGQTRRIVRLLNRHGMRNFLETGARYLLDPRRKHYPTLISQDAAGRQFRLEFLKRTVEVAAELQSDGISLWSGAPENGVEPKQSWNYLRAGMEELLAVAESRHVSLALEPEPGMLLESTAEAVQWVASWNSPYLGLTLDIGHVHCVGESMHDVIRQSAPWLRNVHLEDMRVGIHEHLFPGDGAIDFPSVLGHLREIDYREGVYMELSRHGHAFPEVARQCRQLLGTWSGEIAT